MRVDVQMRKCHNDSRIEGVSGRKVRDPQRKPYQVHRTRR